MAIYTCKYCGYQASHPMGVANSSCSYSPTGKCVLMNATEPLTKYTCKYCGYSANHPGGVARSSCSRNPEGKTCVLLG